MPVLQGGGVDMSMTSDATTARDHIAVGRGVSLPQRYWDAVDSETKAHQLPAHSTYIRRVLEGRLPPPDALAADSR